MSKGILMFNIYEKKNVYSLFSGFTIIKKSLCSGFRLDYFGFSFLTVL